MAEKASKLARDVERVPGKSTACPSAFCSPCSSTRARPSVPRPPRRAPPRRMDRTWGCSGPRGEAFGLECMARERRDPKYSTSKGYRGVQRSESPHVSCRREAAEILLRRRVKNPFWWLPACAESWKTTLSLLRWCCPLKCVPNRLLGLRSGRPCGRRARAQDLAKLLVLVQSLLATRRRNRRGARLTTRRYAPRTYLGTLLSGTDLETIVHSLIVATVTV